MYDGNIKSTPAKPAVKSPHPVDVHVGGRVRLRRRFLGLSQKELADALGLTFQQIQKYERGANRVSASKLYETAKVLKVPLSYFFEGFENQDGTERSSQELLSTAAGIELVQAFTSIRDSNRRRKILDLIESLAGD